jgi:MerR family transcriptional regulator/heat shock protein HspR
MNRPIISRDDVSSKLAIPPQVLARYERLGLVRVTHEGSLEGYEPSQVRRLWTITSFQRDLGVNLAGVEVILRLYDQMAEIHGRLGTLARELSEICETQESAGSMNTHE